MTGEILAKPTPEQLAWHDLELGMPFGIYLSPWDRNAPCYHDKEAYDDFYAAQLTDLLTRNGPLAEIWFDGARFTPLTADRLKLRVTRSVQRPLIRAFRAYWVGE